MLKVIFYFLARQTSVFFPPSEIFSFYSFQASILSKSKLWAINLEPLHLNSWFGLLATQRVQERIDTARRHSTLRVSPTPRMVRLYFFGGLSHWGCWTKISYPLLKQLTSLEANDSKSVRLGQIPSGNWISRNLWFRDFIDHKFRWIISLRHQTLRGKTQNALKDLFSKTRIRKRHQM